MTELPEVETIKNDLVKKILQLPIKEVTINKSKLIKGSPGRFKKILANNSFTNISRRGKLLIFHLARGDNYLLVHLKMTGQLVFVNQAEIIAGGHSEQYSDMNLPNKYSHIIFSFGPEGTLFFNDLRQFGFMRLVDEAEKQRILAGYGVEPLTKDFTRSNLEKIFLNKKPSVKTVLLNQKLIAGIGNIYADEICLAAKIHPQTSSSSLTKEQIKKMVTVASKIIKQAIKKRGTTFNDYVDANGNQGGFIKFLKVYGRTGKTCLVCRRAKIKKIKLNGRGTHYCPFCQP